MVPMVAQRSRLDRDLTPRGSGAPVGVDFDRRRRLTASICRAAVTSSSTVGLVGGRCISPSCSLRNESEAGPRSPRAEDDLRRVTRRRSIPPTATSASRCPRAPRPGFDAHDLLDIQRRRRVARIAVELLLMRFSRPKHAARRAMRSRRRYRRAGRALPLSDRGSHDDSGGFAYTC
jgi:hypothetical protein